MALVFDGDSSVSVSSVGGNPRILGDFSNATIASRVAFQTSTTDANTVVTAIPNGTATTTSLQLYNNSTPTNAAGLQLFAYASEVRVASGITGTGTYLPMTFHTGGSERVRIDTAGNVGIGTSSPGYRLDVQDASAATRVFIKNTNNAAGGAGVYMQVTNGASVVTDNTIRSDNSGNMAFFTGTSSGSERMRINAAGGVGIGTTNPSERLDVNGSVKMSGKIYTQYVETTYTTNQTCSITVSANGEPTVYHVVVNLELGGSGCELITGYVQYSNSNAAYFRQTHSSSPLSLSVTGTTISVTNNATGRAIYMAITRVM